VLVIHSTGDQLIPVQHAERLAAAAPTAQLWLVQGHAHGRSYAHDPPAYIDRIATFFHDSLRLPATTR
jgi:uncharacterized protein